VTVREAEPTVNAEILYFKKVVRKLVAEFSLQKETRNVGGLAVLCRHFFLTAR